MTSLLDKAYAALLAGEDGLTFYRALADAELFLVLEAEAEGEVLSPRVFDLSDGPMLLVFDDEARLAGFAAGPVPYAALPGRVIAAQILGQGLSLGLNLGSGAASEVILPPDAIDWLIQMLDQAPPEQVQAQVLRFEPPVVPQAVLTALGAVMAQGVAQAGWLAGVVYDGGRRGVMLALTGVVAGDEGRMARAVTEALAFSGLDASTLDVVFAAQGGAVLARMAGVGLVFAADIRAEPAVVRTAPGCDPSRPPVLR